LLRTEDAENNTGPQALMDADPGTQPQCHPTDGGYYGLLANGQRAANIAPARRLLAMPAPAKPSEPTNSTAPDQPRVLPRPCPCCGGRMIGIEIFEPWPSNRADPMPPMIRIDTS
jgi:hypothetical protein